MVFGSIKANKRLINYVVPVANKETNYTFVNTLPPLKIRADVIWEKNYEKRKGKKGERKYER